MLPETNYQYIGDKVCISQKSLVNKGIIKLCHRPDGRATSPLWDKWMAAAKKAGRIIQLGGNNRTSMIELEAIPSNYRQQVIELFGNPEQVAHPLEKYFVMDADARVFYESYKFDDGTYLTKEQITRYTINASLLNALPAFQADRANMRRRSGHSARGVWQSVIEDILSFNDTLKLKYGVGHTIKQTRLSAKLKQYNQEGYINLVDGRNRNKAASKIEIETERTVLLEELLKKHSNFNDEQVRSLYNMAAERLGWPSISRGTVANHREKLGIYTESGSRGLTHFRTTRSMQVKRSAPSVSMAYWSIDGWDAELLYQKFEDGKTTYHNRLTVVTIIDPVMGLKYPIGYAIGTHETPDLIRQALRNAVNHTKELFGQRYKTLQLQSDRYAIKNLTPTYEAVSKISIPAAVKNSKAKIIERYHLHLNKLCQMYYPKNWSGHNMDANRDNQPNEDYLNKVRHSFPDEQGVREQISRLLEMERSTKCEAYIQAWEMLPENERIELPTAEYLYLFGETHTHTNRIQGKGFAPTLMGESFDFDTFDTRFRELAYIDWAVKYDPADMSSVLVMDAKADHNKKVVEIIGNHRFELTAKHVQPMALYDRKEGDADELHKVFSFNKKLETAIVDRNRKNGEVLSGLFIRNPELSDTLTKMVLCDSTGQHKDVRNLSRAKTQKQLVPVTKSSTATEQYEIEDDDVRTMYGTSI